MEYNDHQGKLFQNLKYSKDLISTQVESRSIAEELRRKFQQIQSDETKKKKKNQQKNF